MMRKLSSAPFPVFKRRHLATNPKKKEKNFSLLKTPLLPFATSRINMDLMTPDK